MRAELNKSEALKVIREALDILGEKYQGKDAERMLLAIGYQESGFKHRKQINGPAKGFWQFERGGGVMGVMGHPATKNAAKKVCEAFGVEFDSYTIHVGFLHSDVFAACFARLLLYSHPKPLPTNENDAWRYYIDTWRPGKPHRDRWTDNWKKSQINNSMYKFSYLEERSEQLPEFVNQSLADCGGGVCQIEQELNHEQANELDCARVDGVVLEIIPPAGEPDPKCSR